MSFWDLLKSLTNGRDRILKSKNKPKTIKDIELEKCKELNGKEKIKYENKK